MLYTSLQYSVFNILVKLLERFQSFNYYAGWKVANIPLCDQLLMMLMKLKLNCRDLDLAERFCVRKTTVSNVVKTLISVLHEILFVAVMSQMPSQVK